jgi:hypothetical protein
MMAALILVLSIVATLEFAVAQWRSMWIAASSQPLSESFQAATGIAPQGIRAEHFEVLARTSDGLPFASARNRDERLREVRVYYRLVQALERTCARALPAASNWAKGELIACTHYAAAVLDQRLNANLGLAIDVRAF